MDNICTGRKQGREETPGQPGWRESNWWETHEKRDYQNKTWGPDKTQTWHSNRVTEHSDMTERGHKTNLRETTTERDHRWG